MINILEQFANDNLHPNSRSFRQNSNFAREMKRLVEAENALRDSLCEQGKSLLEDYIGAQDAVNDLSGTDKFIYGYHLGVLMTMEVFRTSDEIVTGGESA